VAITVICILSIIGLVLGVIGLVAGAAAISALGVWFLIYQAIALAVGAVCTYGLWMMKKWALYLYTALFVVAQAIGLLIGGFSLIGLVIPLIVLAICWAYQGRMT
jgi:hypothetical protein